MSRRNDRDRRAVCLAVMTEAYLLDLDGVLVDSVAAAARAWTWWAGLHGLSPSRFIGAHGRPSREAIAELAPQLDARAEAERVEEREINDTEGVIALPGAEEMLGQSRPLAIVTSGATRLAEARLRAAGLPRPQVLVSADCVSRGKPDPEPYLLAARQLGVSPARCTVFEDAPAGVAAGRAAGMSVVALTTTVSADELRGADRIVADLGEYLDGEAA